MRAERNPMKPEDVTLWTEIEVSVFKRARTWADDRRPFRPTAAYVHATKPCGCEGPHLGKVETVQLDRAVFSYKTLPPHNERPRLGGQMFRTLKEAWQGKPRLQMKLWGVYPDKPYRYGVKRKPIGYVWGQDNAVKALKEYWIGE